MNQDLIQLAKSLSYNQTLDESSWNSVIAKIDFNMPEDYVEFMKRFNGGEGSLGENNYIRLWPFEELFEANQDYQVEVFAPALFLIGSDGGGTAYGIRKSDGIFVEVPFIGLDDNAAVDIGTSFLDFLSYLSRKV